MNEKDYIQGSRAAWVFMLRECCRQLGYGAPEVEEVAWIAEREAAKAVLRDVFGDAWPSDLHLADIIEKYLIEHHSIDNIAYQVTQRRLCELLVRLSKGEALSPGELRRYGALVAPAYQTPEFQQWWNQKAKL